jgi:hypothetical protein
LKDGNVEKLLIKKTWKGKGMVKNGAKIW